MDAEYEAGIERVKFPDTPWSLRHRNCHNPQRPMHGGEGAGFTVTVIVEVALPPGPVTVSVYVVVAEGEMTI
jgi:hypothetical protein